MLIFIFDCIICGTRYFYPPITPTGDHECRSCNRLNCFDISELDIDKEVADAQKKLVIDQEYVREITRKVKIFEMRVEYLLEVQKANP